MFKQCVSINFLLKIISDNPCDIQRLQEKKISLRKISQKRFFMKKIILRCFYSSCIQGIKKIFE